MLSHIVHVCVCDWRTHAWECGCGGKLLVLLDQHTHSCPSPPLHLSACCVVLWGCVCAQVRRLLDEGADANIHDPACVWIGYLGRMGSCVGHNPKHTFTHPHTSSIHTHGSASMLHACRLCVGMCVWIEMWGSTHTQLRWNVRIWGMGCTLPHTQACLGCGVCVCSPFLISPLLFSVQCMIDTHVG